MNMDFKFVKESLDATLCTNIKEYCLDIPDAYKSCNFTDKNADVAEYVEWITCNPDLNELDQEELLNMLVRGVSLSDIDNETEFCDAEMLQKILGSKVIVGQMSPQELVRSRSRANPFESIKSVFFMNRAALKMANIDAATNFMFTDIDRNIHHSCRKGLYYFADVCAGPGGFSEYILWRKRWLFKGFGLTLRGEHDFKLTQSICASDATFRSYYGANDDGDIYRPENIADFKEKIMHETDGLGVHFMMADGGFSVEGQEKIQEVLSKQIYICQCFLALEIVREYGHFVTKMFDTYTRFTVGLLYLMYRCFEKFTILKPRTSRPANSERYVIFYGKRNNKYVNIIRKHLRHIVECLFYNRLHKIEDEDIIEIISLESIKSDTGFANFITECNNRIGTKQITSLLKLGIFYYNRNLVEKKQSALRTECLKQWRVPDRTKESFTTYSIQDLLMEACSKPEFLYVQPRNIDSLEDLTKILEEPSDWHYAAMASEQHKTICNIYAAIGGSRVFRLQKSKWVRIKNVRLVKGTLIYGEMVQEKCINKSNEEIEKQSLHVIDAMRLGDISLADLPFTERAELIQTYCSAVNFETSGDTIRIRHKPLNLLSCFKVCTDNISILPTLCFNSHLERFAVNSILFLKTTKYNLFNTTYVLRAQLFTFPPGKVSANDLQEYILKTISGNIAKHCDKA